jgi:hypothetical protein
MQDLFDDIKISHSCRYFTANGRIYDAVLDKSALIESVHPLFWLQFMKENSIASYKRKKLSESDLQSMLRKSVYNITETFDNAENKLKTLMEYEIKFGSSLIMESENPLVFEKSLKEGWNFLIENAVRNFPGFEGVVITEGFLGDLWDGVTSFGSKVVDVVGGALDTVATRVKKAGSWLADNTVVGGWIASGYKWLKEKGITWLMEGLRSAVYSPVGMGVEVFLTVTGVGAPIVMVVYGVLLLWDLSKMASGDPTFSWWEVFFDILGIVTSGIGAAPARLAIKETGIMAKTAGKSLGETVQIGAKQGGVIGSFLKKLGTLLGKGVSGILGFVQQGAAWLGKNFGFKSLEKYVGSAKTYVDDLVKSINKVDNVLPSAAVANKTVVNASEKAVAAELKKPGVWSKVKNGWNAAGKALDKPIEKLLPATANKFEKNVFGKAIKNPGKISTGLRTGLAVGGIGQGIHSYADSKRAEAEKQAGVEKQEFINQIGKKDADYSDYMPD